MNRIRLSVAVMLAAIVLGSVTCESRIEENLLPEDLFGTWQALTSNGRAELVFSRSDGRNRYAFQAPDGTFGNIVLLPGSDVMSQGFWSLDGVVLSLLDEGGLPLSCPLNDPFEVLMSDKRDAFTLTYLGEIEDGCLTRAGLLEEAGWSLQSSGA